jgi:uncharacterized protein YndB with AHSA1/START domain
MNADFDTFTIVRSFKCTPAQLFRAWADPAAKAAWFMGPPDQWTLIDRYLDFREGGNELLKGNFAGRTETLYTAHYFEIVENQRIGYGFDVRLNGEIYSISTAIVEFSEGGFGAEMKFTEMIAYLDGDTKEQATPGRIKGTNEHYDRLEKYLG